MKKLKKLYWTGSAIILGMAPYTAFAAPDAVSVINNLKDFMLTILSTVGVILVIWGIVQVAMGFKSQDGTQKTHGVLFLAGGAIIASVGMVLNLLGF